MNRKLIETLREYADIAESGEKSHWALAMRQAAEYISADLAKLLPEPDAFIVLDSAGDHVYSSPHKQFCHDHINDLLMNESDLAGELVVRGFYAEPPTDNPMTEEEFLNLKLPCDIKIGNGKNVAGTTIKTLLLRANSIYEGAMMINRKPLPEPVGEITILGNYGVIGGPFIGVKWASGAIPSVGTKLYTEPTARKPLTDDEIMKIWFNNENADDPIAYARAVEEKHGIKEQE